MKTLKERFFAKVNKRTPSGCWEWTASKYTSGYGQMWDGKRLVGAHRISYEMHKGPIPAGMHICHRCDVRTCVNPEHLFAGTPSENIADMVEKGRNTPPRGEMCGRAVLTDTAVRVIRRLISLGTLTQKEIGAMFGVGDTAISRVKNGKRWSHI